MRTGKNFKLAIAAIAAVVIAVAGYLAFSTYEQHKFLNSVATPVKNTSLRVENAIHDFTEKGTGITYEETIPKIDDDIAAIGKSILDVQTNANTSNKENVELVVAYMRSCQELLRAMNRLDSNRLSFWRNNSQVQETTTDMQLAMNKALTKDGSVRDYSAFLEFERLLKIHSKLTDNLKKALEQGIKDADDLYRVTKKTQDVYLNVSGSFPPDALINPKTLDVLIEYIKEKLQEKDENKDTP